MKFCVLFSIAMAVGLLSQAGGVAAQQPIAIATPPSGSIYNSSAAAIGKVLADKAGLRMTLQAMGGSSQYLPIVNAGEVPLGIANVYETSLAVKGEDYFKGRPNKDLRVVAILYPLRNTIFVKKDSDIKKLADLKGKRGPTGFTSQRILTSVTNAALAPGGITLDDVKGVNVANIISNVNAFKEGRTDFFVFALGGAPIREADAAVGGVRALTAENTPAVVAAVKKQVPVAYLRLEKPSPANTGLLEQGYLVSYGVNLLASTKTPDDVVYKVVKAMHDNAADLGKVFPPLRMLDTKAMAQAVDGAEYHPGAAKYYKEVGQWPPKQM
ncbi:MAG: TAXI family TRAP transporter solute-binding subunit [Rhizobiales bacterium]|nr:TAXI family TRAP transporter solute-binding subunit [Hyphomicrobiales bacterium]